MVIAGAPSDILPSSLSPMSLISITIGPVSQETDHTSPALVGSSGTRNFLFSWFPFLARPGCPGNLLSLRAGEEVFLLQHGGIVGPGKMGFHLL